jgi:hypothetical protein
VDREIEREVGTMQRLKIVMAFGTLVSIVGFLFIMYGVINDSTMGGLIGFPAFSLGLAAAGGAKMWVWLKTPHGQR